MHIPLLVWKEDRWLTVDSMLRALEGGLREVRAWLATCLLALFADVSRRSAGVVGIASSRSPTQPAGVTAEVGAFVLVLPPNGAAWLLKMRVGRTEELGWAPDGLLTPRSNSAICTMNRHPSVFTYNNNVVRVI